MAQNTTTAVNHGEGLRQPETASRCVVERAVHNFEITSYTLLEGMGVGKFITSSTFSAGGYDWIIRFYPDGDRKESAGYASAFLNCPSMQVKDGVRAKFTLAMLDDQGNAQEVDKDYVVVHIFTPEASGFGFTKFVEKSKLKSSPHLHSGCITIRCVLDVIKEPPTECNTNLIVVPTPKLSGQLECALGSGKGVDISLLVGGREFTAHRFMLAARSPVFNAQLFGPMMKKDTHHIEVDDMEPSIFEMLLHFIYTDSLSPCSNDKEDHDGATMQHLLVAADRYGLDGLKVTCEEKLCNSINVKTVKITLAIANKHYCERLEKACVEFMSKPGVAAAVLLSEGFNRLVASCTPLVLEKDQKD